LIRALRGSIAGAREKAARPRTHRRAASASSPGAKFRETDSAGRRRAGHLRRQFIGITRRRTVPYLRGDRARAEQGSGRQQQDGKDMAAIMPTLDAQPCDRHMAGAAHRAGTTQQGAERRAEKGMSRPMPVTRLQVIDYSAMPEARDIEGTLVVGSSSLPRHACARNAPNACAAGIVGGNARGRAAASLGPSPAAERAASAGAPG